MQKRIAIFTVAFFSCVGCAHHGNGKIAPLVEKENSGIAMMAVRPQTFAMTMKEGVSAFIEYQPDDHLPRRATIKQTDIHFPGTPWGSTDDPDWHVQNLFDNGAADYEWIRYLNPDGQGHNVMWQVKVHCEYDMPRTNGVRCWFEHKRDSNGSDDHNDSKMVFIAADGSTWQATLNSPIPRPFPAQVTFTLKKLQ